MSFAEHLIELSYVSFFVFDDTTHNWGSITSLLSLCVIPQFARHAHLTPPR